MGEVRIQCRETFGGPKKEFFLFVVFLSTIALSIFYIISYFISPTNDAKGIPTIVLIVLGLGGIQLVSISVIGDYLGKVIEEVKNRPKFIRSKIIYNGMTYSDEKKLQQLIFKISNKNG